MQSAKLIISPNSAGKLRDAETTKLKLITAALVAFSTRGYDASSTRSIETEAGVKRGLINYHYGSKEALWKAAAEHLMSVTERELGAALDHIKAVEEGARLRHVERADEDSLDMCQ